MNNDKPRFRREMALPVAEALRDTLYPFCTRICVAGSLRRRKPTVGDIELIYVSRRETRRDPEDMYSTLAFPLVDEAIEKLERAGVLRRRKNIKGSEMYGPKNKLMEHFETGIPVDLFATSEECWVNYLVCRTGPAESNTRIALAARERGWKWNPYGTGFSRQSGLSFEHHPVTQEKDVFDFVSLPYAEPWERR